MLIFYLSGCFSFVQGQVINSPPESEMEAESSVSFEKIFSELDLSLPAEIKQELEQEAFLNGQPFRARNREDLDKKVVSIQAGHRNLYKILSTKIDSAFDHGEFGVSMGEETFRHLRILSGDQGAPEQSVWFKLNRAQTHFGRAIFAKILSTPTTNLELLKARQSLLKKMLEDQDFFENLDSKISKIKLIQKDLIEVLATDPSKDYENILHKSFGLYWKGVGTEIAGKNKPTHRALDRKRRILDKKSWMCNLNAAWVVIKDAFFIFDAIYSLQQGWQYAYGKDLNPYTKTFENRFELDNQTILSKIYDPKSSRIQTLYQKFSLGRLIYTKSSIHSVLGLISMQK